MSLVKIVDKIFFSIASCISISLFTVTAFAGDVVGKITAIDYAKGVVIIDGHSYRVSPALEENKASEKRGPVALPNFRYGQIVQFSVDGNGAVDSMSVLNGLTQVPK